jgi:hypothetical protein
MFQRPPSPTRIGLLDKARLTLICGAGIALGVALAASQPSVDKAHTASSGAGSVERAPSQPLVIAAPQDVAKVAAQVKPAVIAVISHVVERGLVALPCRAMTCRSIGSVHRRAPVS